MCMNIFESESKHGQQKKKKHMFSFSRSLGLLAHCCGYILQLNSTLELVSFFCTCFVGFGRCCQGIEFSFSHSRVFIWLRSVLHMMSDAIFALYILRMCASMYVCVYAQQSTLLRCVCECVFGKNVNEIRLTKHIFTDFEALQMLGKYTLPHIKVADRSVKKEQKWKEGKRKRGSQKCTRRIYIRGHTYRIISSSVRFSCCGCWHRCLWALPNFLFFLFFIFMTLCACVCVVLLLVGFSFLFWNDMCTLLQWHVSFLAEHLFRLYIYMYISSFALWSS